VRDAPEPFLFVVDDAHLLRSPAAGDALAAVAAAIPHGSQLLVTGRGRLPVPVAALRADGRVVEIGAHDLAMSADEAGMLLGRMGCDLTKREVDGLFRMTEGWAALLHLAGASLEEGRFDRGATFDHLPQAQAVVDYLRSEVLAGLPRNASTFLERTSMLRELSAPLCDAALETTSSARRLADLVAMNVPVTALDQHGERFRVHGLLRRVLRSDLGRHDPSRAAGILRRAASWSEEQGLMADALAYAGDLGEPDLLARMLADHALGLHRRGQADLVVPWFGWFEEHDLQSRYPRVAATGAWVQIYLGRAVTVRRWAEAAQHGLARLPAGERRQVQAILLLVDAAACRMGPGGMERDAGQALGLLPAASEWRPIGVFLQAAAAKMRGDGPDTDPLFVGALEEALDRHAHPTAAVALAERAVLATEQDDWLGAEDLIGGALDIVEMAGLREYATTALVHAVAARVAFHRGDLVRGRGHLGEAHRLRNLTTHAAPFLAVQVRLEMARAYMAVTDSAGARTMLRELESLFALRGDLGVFRQQADEVHGLVGSMRATFVGGSSLTTAELRLLPLLATHFSFREIADRLYVSRHTVKTQAISIYRKLRVTSRSEAVETARGAGLLAS